MNVRDLETISVRSLKIYATSCQTLNLTQCADLLGLPKSTVSKEISKLESQFSTKLLERSTRNIYITEAGKLVYQHALRMLDGFQTLHDDVKTMKEQVQGLLQISAPPILGEMLSQSFIPEFLARWPKTAIRLSLSYSIEDLFSEGLDLAIRVGQVRDDRLIGKQIGSTTRVIVASPAYLAQFEAPDYPADLSKHNCLRFGFNLNETEWHLASAEDKQLVNVRGNFFCANISALRQMTLQGAGLAQLPISAIKNDLARGDLIRVLPDWSVPTNPIYALYRVGVNKPKKLQALLNYIDARQALFELNA